VVCDDVKVEFEGVTGPIQFDRQGYRRNYTLDILEMTFNSRPKKVRFYAYVYGVRFKSKFKSNFDRHWFLNHRDYYFRQGCHVIIAFACSSDSRIAQQVADRFLGSFLEWWYA